MSAAGAARGPWALRRTRVLERLGERAALVLAASPELRIGDDTELRYVADSNLFYLTGYLEPDAVLVLCPARLGQPAGYTLFVRPRNPERERWTGPRGGVEAAIDRFGADAAHPIAELPARLPGLLEHTDHLYYRFGASRSLDRTVLELLAAGRAHRPRTGRGLHTVSDPGLLLDELRLVKDDYEISRLRAACDITVAAFRELRDVLHAGAGEWQVEAALEAGFRRRGATGPAFPTIVGSGDNATVLHYTANRAVLGSGEVVLVDGGASAGMYCSDITRCYPVDGEFSPAQRALYDVVWRAHDAAIAVARPGAAVADIHDAAARVLVEGLVDLRLLHGEPEALIAAPENYRRFCPHTSSHWLGLEVHDAGDYLVAGAPRLLAAGMVLTVEPGLYINAAETAGPAELRGTGIRLEDDVLITASGNEVLSARLPLDPGSLFD